MSEIEDRLKAIKEELEDLKSKAKEIRREEKAREGRMGIAHILKDGELVDCAFDPTQPKFHFENFEYDVKPKGIFYEKPWHGLTLPTPHIFWHEHNPDPISLSLPSDGGTEPPTPEELEIMASETSTRRGLHAIFKRPVNISPRLVMFLVGIAVVAVVAILKMRGG